MFLTSTEGSSATFRVNNVRNFSPYYWTTARTILIGDANADLSWTEGMSSTSSDVYFGTNPTPDTGEFKGNQAVASFDPGTLTAGTYY